MRVAAYVFAALAALGTVLLLVLLRKSQFDDEDDVMMAAEAADDQLAQMAQAIAHAEGYGIPGAIPTRAHNPGDLVIPGWSGEKLGSEGISVFPGDNSDAEGWRRLYRQLELIREGHSHVYAMNMTILDMAKKWTATQPEDWARNVANYLTVTVNTKLSDPSVLGMGVTT